jgi:hypothetical protein
MPPHGLPNKMYPDFRLNLVPYALCKKFIFYAFKNLDLSGVHLIEIVTEKDIVTEIDIVTEKRHKCTFILYIAPVYFMRQEFQFLKTSV